MSGEELKPADCPFCGGNNQFTERSDFSSSYVVCNDCGARGPTECQESDDEDEPGRDAAIRAWQARVPASAHPLPEQPQEGVVKAIKEIERIALIARSDSAQRISPHWLASECNAILCAISKGATDD